MTTLLFKSFEQAKEYVQSLPPPLLTVVCLVARGGEFVVEGPEGIKLPPPRNSARNSSSSRLDSQTSTSNDTATDNKPTFKPQLTALRRKTKRKLPTFESTYRDALDHPARLIGSYGSGKRK